MDLWMVMFDKRVAVFRGSAERNCDPDESSDLVVDLSRRQL